MMSQAWRWQTIAAVLGLTLLAGCSSCDEEEAVTPPATECTAGAEGCLCDEGACSGDALVCDRGYCVPSEESCTPGGAGCMCREDGTCDAGEGGALLRCQENRCLAVEGPAEGELGGACFSNGTCSDYEGEALECLNDRCELPGCTSGTLGCPCDPLGACVDADATCNADNRCTRVGCTEGEEGCACGADASCSGELSCDAGLCRYRNRLSVSVSDPEARACDVFVKEGSRAVSSVVFSEGVVGEWLREGKRLGVSFVVKGDAPLTGRAFTVVLEGDTAGAAADFTPARVECFDAQGGLLSGVSLGVSL